MRSITQVLTLGAVALAAACADQGTPTNPLDGSAHSPLFAIAQDGFATNHNGTNGASSSLTITAPAVQAGDLLIAHIVLSKDISPSQVICAPAGWQSIRRTNHDSGDPIKFKIIQESFYYVAPASQAASGHTWHFKTNAASCGTANHALTGKGASGGIIRYTGVDPVNPIAAWAEGGVTSSSGTTATAPSVTTTADGAQVLRLFSAFKNLTFQGTTPPRIFSVGSSNNSSERTAAAYQSSQESAGSTGTFAARLSTSAEWLAQTIALRPGAMVTVNKVVVNEALEEDQEDSGLFSLQINGTTRAANVGDGGTTGKITVSAGEITVGEIAGAATSLDDYVTVVECDNDKGSNNGTSHTFEVAAGEDVTCTITNTRKAQLTVSKLLVPDTDAGRFNLEIDGETAGTGANVGHNGTTGAVKLAPGDYTVGESAANEATDLDDYITTFGGDCDEDGEITLTSGQVASCTITNTRKPTLTVTKVLSPTDDPGKFDLLISGTVYKEDAGHNGSTGAVKLAPGEYTVSEEAGTDTSLDDYTSVIGGDCAADGSITLAAGENKSCTITNTRNVSAPSETVLYLHNNPTPPTGNTVAQANLPLDPTAPTATVLHNYATNLDNNAGVTGRFMDKISASDAQSTTDLQKYQTWRTAALASDLVINGTVELKIWAKMKASGKNIQLRAFLRDCDSSLSSCTNFATLDMVALTNASSSAFQELTVSASGVSRTLSAGRVLQVRVVMLDISDADPAYLAYDTQAYPARLIIP